MLKIKIAQKTHIAVLSDPIRTLALQINKFLLADEDTYLDIFVPSQSNFNKKIKDVLGNHYVRERLHTYTRDKCSNCNQLVGEIQHYDMAWNIPW